MAIFDDLYIITNFLTQYQVDTNFNENLKITGMNEFMF